MLGAEWYVDHPLYPLAKTLGMKLDPHSLILRPCTGILNMDMLNIFGPVHDISFYGWGQGGLEPFAEKAAAIEARKITEEPNPQDGLFFRSDQYALLVFRFQRALTSPV